MGRIRAGEVYTRNPLNPAQLTRVPLSPEVVDGIVLWTKDPAPLVPYLEELTRRGFVWYLQFTVTPYGSAIERGLREKSSIEATFCEIAARFGAQRLVWRYDPILLTDVYTVDRHLSDFASMCANLKGATDTCVISFIDLYEKVKRNFPQVKAVPREDRLLLGREMQRIAASHGMRLVSCCEGDELAPFGVDCSGCMTLSTYEKAIGCRLHAPKQPKTTRGCLCHLSCDIGAYNTCGHGCRYCYANHDEAAVRRAMAMHDPASPLLIGHVQSGEVIRDATQASWKDGQISLF